MEHTITATDLARRLGDVLARVRYRHDTFIVERNGAPVARLVPHDDTGTTVAETLRAWREAGVGDATFADDLERIGEHDTPPANPWGS